MNDPYSGVLFEKALTALGERFGSENIRYHPSNGDVFIDMPLANGGTFTAGLTWQQAKCLAFNPQLRGDDLIDRRFPPDWPVESSNVIDSSPR